MEEKDDEFTMNQLDYFMEEYFLGKNSSPYSYTDSYFTFILVKYLLVTLCKSDISLSSLKVWSNKQRNSKFIIIVHCYKCSGRIQNSESQEHLAGTANLAGEKLHYYILLWATKLLLLKKYWSIKLLLLRKYYEV